MSDRLKREIKQSKPFSSQQEEAVLGLMRTASVLERASAELLKRVDLSPVQYNVLRILNGVPHEGLACKEIAERLITHDPDITRLLDRMEKRDLIRRVRSSEDRRIVKAFIAGEGKRLAEEMAQPLTELNKHLLRTLNERKVQDLISIMEEIREAAENEKV